MSLSWFVLIVQIEKYSTGNPLPSEKDFRFESISQAIELEIQGTLNSIAEICSRSKLWLMTTEAISHRGKILPPRLV